MTMPDLAATPSRLRSGKTAGRLGALYQREHRYDGSIKSVY